MRYPGYDYRQAGEAFGTICTHHRQQFFGFVHNGMMTLSPQGEIADQLWMGITERFPGVIVDGILFVGTDPQMELFALAGDIVHWFKIRMQAAYRKNLASGRWRPYRDRLWQRDVNDRIIRSDRELDQVRDYILANPERWAEKHSVA